MEKHRQVLRTIRRALPTFMSEHCLDCVTRHNRIIVYSDSAAWATRIRFYVPTILKTVNNAEQENYESVQVRVFLPLQAVAGQNRKARLPSTPVARQILENAEFCPDGTLKQSLLRLGRTLEKKSRNAAS